MAINNSVTEVLDQLKTVSSLVLRATEANSLPEVLQEIAEASRKLVHAKYAALGIPDGMGSFRYFKFSGISDENSEKIAHPPLAKGLLGTIMNERVTLRLSDMQHDDRAAGFPEGHPHMTSLLGVPIEIGDELFGMLYISDRDDGQPFEYQDEWLIKTLAGYAAVAIANAQRKEQEHQIKLWQERNRIGMELHDGVIQSLYAIGMQLDVANRTNNLNGETISTALNDINQVIEDIRAYIMQLNLKTQCQTMRGHLEELLAGLHIPDTIALHINAPDEIPPMMPTAFDSICLIANEAVSNAIRHAHAENITVSLKIEGDHLHIGIEDDGIGFNLEQVQNSKGLGLRNLQERARLHRGKVTITAHDGTRIFVTIPLSNA